MTPFSIYSKSILFFLLSTAPFFSAFSADDHERHNHGPHLHGHAELTIAVENNKLEMSFRSPAINIVGFEHRASSPEQIQLVENAKKTLESPQAFFSYQGSECKLKQATVNVSGLMSGHEKEHGKHEHDEHREVLSLYHYICATGAQLKSLTVNIFEQFTGIETINAMWVTADRQGAMLLSAENKVINLK